jgi:3-phosphoglycerate kinase
LQQKEGDIQGKICLLRVDLNVLEKEKDNYRLLATLPTMRFLLSQGATLMLVSHRGRPKKKNSSDSLRPYARVIQRYLGESVKFFPAFDWEKIRWDIATKRGKIFLLENIRFLEGEEKNSISLARALASLADFYVNDAFAVSHRAHASVHAITKFLPSYAGLSLEKEIVALKKIKEFPARPLIVLVGGVKTADKIEILSALLPRTDAFLLGGGVANTFLSAMGFPVGNSVRDEAFVPRAKKLLQSGKIVFPEDFIISKNRILDIGKKTQKEFSEFVALAKTIIWVGPLGFYHKKIWSGGTRALWRAVLKNKKAFILAGGGETIASLALVSQKPDVLMKKRKNIYFSTGGGAMVEFLSGKKLPGIVALEKSKKEILR